jgi:hypothetical protein
MGTTENGTLTISGEDTTLGAIEQWRAQNNVSAVSIQFRAGTWTVTIKDGPVNYTAMSPKLVGAWNGAEHSYATRGEGMMRAELEKALKHPRNANRLGQLVDTMRAQGLLYMDIVTLAQEVDPTLTLAEWETLMQEAEAVDEDDIAESTYEVR